MLARATVSVTAQTARPRSPEAPAGRGDRAARALLFTTMTTIAITHDDRDIGRAIEEALGALVLDELMRGRRVAIKPNDTWAIADDTTGVTQAATFRASATAACTVKLALVTCSPR